VFLGSFNDFDCVCELFGGVLESGLVCDICECLSRLFLFLL
jgi:hypothetical protein